MKSLIYTAMVDGAVGFSTGLQYVPGTYARSNEIIELARVAANEGGIYATHMRNEGTELEASVRESINVARTLDMGPADFASQGGQPESLGRQRGGARADRRGPGTGGARRGRSVRLLRGVVVVCRSGFRRGRSRETRECARSAERPGGLGEDQAGDGGAARRTRVHGPVVGRRWRATGPIPR